MADRNREGRGKPGLRYLVVSLVAPLVIIFLILLALNRVLFWVDSVPSVDFAISQPSLGTLFTAAVALTSLFLAWKKFLYRKQPFVTAKFDYEYEDGEEAIHLKLINSGDSAVLTEPFRWGFAEIEDGKIYIANRDHAAFEEDHLPPHKSASVELGRNLVVVRVPAIAIQGADGEDHVISGPKDGRNTVRLQNIPDEYHDLQVDIQRLFDRVQQIEYRVGTSFDLARLGEETIDDLLEGYQVEEGLSMTIWDRLKDRYERKRYGYAVAGGVPGDKISAALFRLAGWQRWLLSRSQDEE